MKLHNIAFVFLSMLTTVGQAGFYRWVDANGEVHYSDEVPPSAAQNGHEELDQTGITVKSVSAAPTSEEVTARQQEALQEKLRASQNDEQQKRDQYLLATYADVNELESAFTTKLDSLDKSASLMKEHIAKLEESLIESKQQLNAAKGEIKRKNLESFMQDSENTLRDYNQALKASKEERQNLVQRHDEDKKRLQELLSASPSSPRPDPSKAPAAPHEEPVHQ